MGPAGHHLIMGHGLMINEKKFLKDTKNLRKSNLFELQILENEKKYLNIDMLLETSVFQTGFKRLN